MRSSRNIKCSEYLDSHTKQRQFAAVFIFALGPQQRFPRCLYLLPSPLPPKLVFYRDTKTCDVQCYHKQSILQSSRMRYQVGWQTCTEVLMKFLCPEDGAIRRIRNADRKFQ